MSRELNKIPNRLINEKSPYLLQHAYNPVDWYPWDEEAFEKAKSEDKPIFLSIGYSACHWCHVMENESFEDEKIAKFLNDHYISIKVDREERPDVDSIYMSVCLNLTGSGGWPLTILMDAHKKPFYAGTYFPKENSRGMPGFINIIEQLNEIWTSDRARIDKSSEEITKSLKGRKYKEKEISPEIIEKAKNQLRENFDKTYGGFSNAPKFPSPQNLMFLLRADETKDLVTNTLDNMYRGGIYDHIGFGFSRYSTDRKWLVPHFEKMLYDNALLSMVYSETYKATGNIRYKIIAEEIFSYILRDMTSKEGAFYSAEDADSSGVEGMFYVWNRVEILDILGYNDGEKFCQRYNITDQGNFENLNIPNLINKPLETEDEDFYKICIRSLFAEREKRIHPLKDKKILTSWNGLMIVALAIGGKNFNESDYILKAKNAADFILDVLMPNGQLKARYCDGEIKHDAFAEDYSFLIWGLIELYQAGYDEKYLEKAIYLTDQFIDQFWDFESAGFFLYGKYGEKMISRPKEIYDGATPSANSVSTYNLIRLSRLTGKQEYEEKALKILNYFATQIENIPMGHTFSLISLWFLQNSPKEVAMVCENDQIAKPMIDILNKKFRPNITSVLISENHRNIKEISPFTKNYNPTVDVCRAYVCENNTCNPPVDSLEGFENLL